MGIAQIDPLRCQTDKRGKKVLQTILASLYTPPPLRAMPMWKHHISKRGFPELSRLLFDKLSICNLYLLTFRYRKEPPFAEGEDPLDRWRQCRPQFSRLWSQAKPTAAHYSPLQPSTAQYSPANPRRVQYRPVQPSIAQYSQEQPSTATKFKL